MVLNWGLYIEEGTVNVIFQIDGKEILGVLNNGLFASRLNVNLLSVGTATMFVVEADF